MLSLAVALEKIIPAGKSDRPWDEAASVLWCLLLAALVAYTFFFLRFSLSLLRYPFDLQEADGQVLIAVKLMEQGRPFYDHPLRFPLYPTVYPPLFPGLVYLLTRWFGDSVVVARGVSIFSAFAVSLLIYRFSRRYAARRVPALVAALLPFSFPAVSLHLASAKSDSLFCLFLATGFCLIPWASEAGGRYFRPAALATLFLAAALTKQTGMPAAAVAGVAIGLADFRRGVVFSAVFGASFLAATLLLDAWSGGWFYRDVIHFAAKYGRACPIEPMRLLLGWLPCLAAFAGPLAVSIWLVARARSRRILLAALPFLLFGLAWTLQVGRNGCARNHCLPALVATCIAFGIAAGARWGGPDGKHLPGKLPGAAVAALLLLGLVVPLDQLKFYEPPSARDRETWTRMIGAIAAMPGPVLVDYAGSAAVAAGKWEYSVDSANLNYGRVDAGPTLVPMISERRFSAILLYRHTFFAPEIKEAIKRNYRIVEQSRIRTDETDQERDLLLAVPNG